MKTGNDPPCITEQGIAGTAMIIRAIAVLCALALASEKQDFLEKTDAALQTSTDEGKHRKRNKTEKRARKQLKRNGALSCDERLRQKQEDVGRTNAEVESLMADLSNAKAEAAKAVADAGAKAEEAALAQAELSRVTAQRNSAIQQSDRAAVEARARAKSEEHWIEHAQSTQSARCDGLCADMRVQYLRLLRDTLTGSSLRTQALAGVPGTRPPKGITGLQKRALKFQSLNLNSRELELSNFLGLVLGCIEAKFCK